MFITTKKLWFKFNVGILIYRFFFHLSFHCTANCQFFYNSKLSACCVCAIPKKKFLLKLYKCQLITVYCCYLLCMNVCMYF